MIAMCIGNSLNGFLVQPDRRVGLAGHLPHHVIGGRQQLVVHLDGVRNVGLGRVVGGLRNRHLRPIERRGVLIAFELLGADAVESDDLGVDPGARIDRRAGGQLQQEALGIVGLDPALTRPVGASH